MTEPGRSVDEPPLSIASPEIAAEYFRRLRWNRWCSFGFFFFMIAGATGVQLLPGVVWRIVCSVVCFCGWFLCLLLPGKFFSCPACGYFFAQGRYKSEPKWHQCPSCRVQYTPTRVLRVWPGKNATPPMEGYDDDKDEKDSFL
jgi:hypothetical protein